MLGSLVEVSLDFDSNKMDFPTATGVTNTFRKTLSELMGGPNRLVGQLSLLSNDDVRRLLSWNCYKLDATEACIHHLVAEHMEQQPEKPAICSWDGQLSYRQLDEFSAHFAHRLTQLGVGPEVMVPICFEKSMWAVVAMMAILKVGGAFVPLDPDHPESRLETIVNSVQASVIMASETQEPFIQSLELRIPCLTVSFPSQLDNKTATTPDVLPSNAAYMVFTSGSTGVPKGVVVEHTALSTSVREQARVMRITQQSRVLQYASFTFDVSIGDIFTTLVAGGCLCIPSAYDRTHRLAGYINEIDVDHACLTASVASLLKPEDTPTLKVLTLGGEPMLQRNLDTWAEATDLVNIYGPAECTIWCTAKERVGKLDSEKNIGQGVGTAAATWIVDPNDHNQLLPIGAIGELLIEGPLLARGYWKDPVKTAESFVANPAWMYLFGLSDHRFYKTGDLVRYNPDGTINFIGRKDSQVKVHGQRIELHEIEYHLGRLLPLPTDVAVEVVTVAGDTQRAETQESSMLLAAFVGLGHNSNHQGELIKVIDGTKNAINTLCPELEQELLKSLPLYMIPSVYIPLTHLPLNASSKINRPALRQFASQLPRTRLASFALSQNNPSKSPPSTEMERQLRDIWAETLSLDATSLGIRDRFLQLGGDSIDAIRLVSIARWTKIFLTVADILRNPTIAELALVASTVDNTDINLPQPFALLGKHRDIAAEEVLVQCEVADKNLIEDIYPCTPLQEGLMALSLKQQGTYVSQNTIELAPSVDIEAFRHAWEAVFSAYSILRTRIVQGTDGSLVQVVLNDRIEWQESEDMQEYFSRDRDIPMACGRPLSRYALVRDAQSGNNVFVWTMHHVLYDGWTMPMLLRDLTKAYLGQDIKTATPFILFIQYVSSNSDRAYEYWKTQLTETTAPVFPTLPSTSYQPRPIRVLHCRIIADKALVNTTMSVLVHATWAVVVGSYTDSDDIVFGATRTGRNAPVPRIDGIPGPTITTVPIRVSLASIKTVFELLQTLHSQAVEMIPFEQMGLQYIQRINSDTQAACKFQSMLVVQPEIPATSPSPEKVLGHCNIADEISDFNNYAILLNCDIKSDHLDIEVSYDDHVIDYHQMKRVMNQFEHVLSQLHQTVKSQTDKPLVELDTFNPHDRNELATWNQSIPAPDMINECVHHTVEKEARRRPEEPALEAWDGQLSYHQLDSVANILARKLVDLGVGPEVMVPICFEKSLWAVVAMVATFKAGGAFVPLDPSYPLARIESILYQVKASVILASPAQCAKLTKSLNAMVFPVDSSLLEKGAWGTSPPRVNVCPNNLAYVIFTSGSTGKPKGIAIEHAALSSSASAHSQVLMMNSSSRVLQFSAYIFDGSVAEIMTTLTKGGCVCIPSDADRLDNLPDFMRQMRVNWAFFTPSVLRTLDPQDVPDLRTIAFGGEPATRDIFDRWAEKVNLMQCYGPTECCIFSTSGKMSANTKDVGNIGLPMGVRCWITDQSNHDRLLPVGAIGELLIEGPLLARGYLNNFAQTAAAFIKNPSWATTVDDSFSRYFYKTGDLVRYSSDGSMVFVGRKDSQVKVRGQRVELGEVEHHLWVRAHVRQAMVIIPSSGFCKQQIVAVIAPDGVPSATESEEALEILPRSVQLEEIRQDMVEHLPVYMVPTVWITVNELPCLLSTKFDRKRVTRWLEDMSAQMYHTVSERQTERHSLRPASVMEKRLQRIWSRVLNIPPKEIGLNDPFIRLGGDSITAMQVVALARRESISLTVQDIFQRKTIPQLAAKANQTEKNTASFADREEEETYFELSPIQHIFFGLYQDENHFNQSFFLRLRQFVDFERLTQGLDAIVRQHSMLRARFSLAKVGNYLQKITGDVVGSYRIKQHSVRGEGDMVTVANTSQKSLDIQRGPILSADLFQTEEGNQVLFLVAHHLVIDLVSWRIILADLEQFIKLGHLPVEKPFSFQSWCRLQQRRKHNEEHSGDTDSTVVDGPFLQHDYWGIEEGSNNIEDVMSEGFTLDEKFTQMLLGPANKALRTQPVEILHAALLHAFSQTFSDRPSPTVFVEGHGRDSKDQNLDLSRTVGWFTTIWPLELPLTPDMDIVDVVRQTKDARRLHMETGWLESSQQYSLPGNQFMEILFNYEGLYQQFEHEDAIIQTLPEMMSQVHDVAGRARRLAVFEISVSIVDGSTHVRCEYSRNVQRLGSVHPWIQEYKTSTCKAVEQLMATDVQPTISDFPKISLTNAGARSLHERLDQVGVSTAEDIEEIYPSSPMQQGILLAQVLNPHLYQIQLLFEVCMKDTSPVDPLRLQNSWQRLVDRHPILRTIFVDSENSDGLWCQVVLKEVSASTEIVYCNDNDAISSLTQKHLPSFRSGQPQSHFTVYVLSSKIYCKLDINHALIDAAAKQLLLQDMSEIYQNPFSDRPCPPYSDFISHLQTSDQENVVRYWREYLADAKSCQFPILNEKPDDMRQSDRPKRVALNLDLDPSLQGKWRQEGVTISNLFQIAWGMVLRLYTGSEQVTFGYLSSGRDLSIDGIDGMVGPLVGMLVRCMTLPFEAAALDVAKQTHANFVEALSRQHFLLADVLHSLDLVGSRLFDTAMSIHRMSPASGSDDENIRFQEIDDCEPTEVGF